MFRLVGKSIWPEVYSLNIYRHLNFEGLQECKKYTLDLDFYITYLLLL